MNRLQRAKIPCAETDIEIRHSICDICCPGNHCGVDAYVKDGTIIKVEGNPEHPINKGLLCTKGLSNRAYIYRKDRLSAPLLRVGARGEGKFKEISWAEAYRTIAERLGRIKAENGPEAVAFYSGYTKWYRPYLQRFAYAFGSPNYGTESSSCFTAGMMAWKTATGYVSGPDIASADLLLGWALNGYYSAYLVPKQIQAARERGMKVIIIDPRRTPATEKLADLHIRPRLGTDGALALAIANTLIQNGWIDNAYISKYVHGFEEYKNYVRGFNETNVLELTGVPYEQVLLAAQMIRESSSMAITESGAARTHHRNGYQNYRAVISLLGITGNYDRKGGQKPAEHTYIHVSSGFLTREHEFIHALMPKNGALTVGEKRFPLWYDLEREMQSNDLSRQILEGTPYPIRAVFAMGMNFRMFPGSDRMASALEKLDFFVDTELFLTDTAKYADIVLPVCSSFERGEFKTYPGGFACYTTPIIAPFGMSKPDTDILSELACEMELEDSLLKSGYEACVRHIIRDLHVTVEDLKAEPVPIRVPDYNPPEVGAVLEQGLRTPTGKFELLSERILQHPEWGLDALPTYLPPYDCSAAEYPMMLCSGARIPNAIHSRLHDVEWERSMRPLPTAEISLEDAAALDISEGDNITILRGENQITVSALPTATIRPGEVYIIHGFREADANLLIDPDNLDPYSGFPAYKSTHCRIRKEG